MFLSYDLKFTQNSRYNYNYCISIFRLLRVITTEHFVMRLVIYGQSTCPLCKFNTNCMRMALREPENGYTSKSRADVNAARWINWCRNNDKSLITALQASIVTDNDSVYEEVGYRKICARWAPRILTGKHESRRFEIAASYLQRFREERSEPLQSMGYHETLGHHFAPLTKQAVMLQKHPTSPTSRTFKVCP